MDDNRELAELERYMIARGGWTYLRLIYLLICLQEIPYRQTILSYGCGMGFHEYYLAKAFPALKVDAMDIDRRAIDYARRNYQAPNLKFLEGDHLCIDGNYDLCFSIEVLEHIPDPWPVLASLCCHAEYLFLLLPQWHMTTYEQKERLLRKLGHYHVGFTIEEIRKQLMANGFQVMKSSNCYWENRGGLVRRLFEKVGAPDRETADIFRRLFRIDVQEGAYSEQNGRGGALGLWVLASAKKRLG